MRSVEQIVEYLRKRIDELTENVLNPDRKPELREGELLIRRELLAITRFIEALDAEGKCCQCGKTAGHHPSCFFLRRN